MIGFTRNSSWLVVSMYIDLFHHLRRTPNNKGNKLGILDKYKLRMIMQAFMHNLCPWPTLRMIMRKPKAAKELI
jgi:hypothetical protein